MARLGVFGVYLASKNTHQPDTYMHTYLMMLSKCFGADTQPVKKKVKRPGLFHRLSTLVWRSVHRGSYRDS